MFENVSSFFNTHSYGLFKKLFLFYNFIICFQNCCVSKTTSSSLAMSDGKEIGDVRKIPSIQQIEWSIPDFFLVAENRQCFYLSSPKFPIASTLWHLKFYPYGGQLFLKPEDCFRNSSSYLEHGAYREYALEYDFGLKKCDGTFERFASGIVKKGEDQNYNNCIFITKAELLERESELVNGNVLTIICTMKCVPEISESSTQPETGLDNGTTARKLISKL